MVEVEQCGVRGTEIAVQTRSGPLGIQKSEVLIGKVDRIVNDE